MKPHSSPNCRRPPRSPCVSTLRSILPSSATAGSAGPNSALGSLLSIRPGRHCDGEGSQGALSRSSRASPRTRADSWPRISPTSCCRKTCPRSLRRWTLEPSRLTAYSRKDVSSWSAPSGSVSAVRFPVPRWRTRSSRVPWLARPPPTRARRVSREPEHCRRFSASAPAVRVAPTRELAMGRALVLDRKSQLRPPRVMRGRAMRDSPPRGGLDPPRNKRPELCRENRRTPANQQIHSGGAEFEPRTSCPSPVSRWRAAMASLALGCLAKVCDAGVGQ